MTYFDKTETSRRTLRHRAWKLFLTLLLTIGLLSGGGMRLSAQVSERQTFNLGTSTPDGVAHPFGVTIAALIKLKLLPQSRIDIDARNTLGSSNNAVHLRNGDLDLGILTSLDAHNASRGRGAFAEQGPDASLRTLSNLWTSTYYFVVKPEHAVTGTFNDFMNLEGGRVALGKRSTGIVNRARSLFAGLDIDIDDTYQRQDLGGAEAKRAFLEGDLDGFLLIDERQGADIRAFMEEAGERAVVLDVGDQHVKAVNGRRLPVWSLETVSPNTFPGQGDVQAAFGLRNLLMANQRVDEEAIYQITKAIFDNLPFLQQMNESAAGVNLETALDYLVVPVHRGAIAYYREVGVTVPEIEPPSISTLTRTPFLTRYSTAEEARQTLQESTVTILGAQSGHTVNRMISELSAALTDTGLRIVSMSSSKNAENLADVLYARGVDGAVVHLDIMQYALDEDVYADLRKNVVYATELIDEEVHLIAAEGFTNIDDLLDQPVNLGPKGSASAFTASFLLDRLNLPVKATYYDQRTALKRLQKGEIKAAFVVSGKPAPILAKLPEWSGLRLLDIPPLEGWAYRPATIKASDYPALLPKNDDVDTFAVRTALLSYNWSPDNPRSRVLASLLGTMFDVLPGMKQADKGYHPKWREIDLADEIEGWARSPTAARLIRRERNLTARPSRVSG